MKLLSIIIATQLLISSFKEAPTSTDTMNFTVKLGNASVGTLQALKTTEDSKVTYSLQSEVRVGMLFLSIDENIVDVFEKGRLSQSLHTRYMNKDLKINNTLISQGGTYHLKNKDQVSKTIKEPIHATVLSAYFKEPHHGQMLFSHYFQEQLVIKKIGTGKYQIDLPNGYKTIYQYKNGDIQSVQSESAWGKIWFIRNE